MDRARSADGPRGGGAIIAANGSLDGIGAVCGVDFAGVVTIGGGPTGFAFSAGSSPGNTQTLFFSSKYACIPSPISAVVASGFSHLVIFSLIPKFKKPFPSSHAYETNK
jgi:sugar/nucleoside kinase (ribokinase family)